MAEARFEESQATELMRGKLVRWSRGQVPASVRFLADKWEWSKGKVDDFLKLLEKMEMITRHQEAGQTVITLSNYDFYNGLGQQNGQRSGQQNKAQTSITDVVSDSGQDSNADKRRTVGGQGPDETNKENKVKTEEEENPSAAGSPLRLKGLKNFQKWIQANAPQVGRLTSPFTEKQYVQIRRDWDINDVMDVLKAMENKKTLLKDYKSAYLTCDNWLKIRAEKGQNRKNDAPQSGQQSKAAIIGQQLADGLSGRRKSPYIKKPVDISSLYYGKVPPQAVQMEEAVLGVIMLERGAIDIVSEILPVEALYVEAHQKDIRGNASAGR